MYNKVLAVQPWHTSPVRASKVCDHRNVEHVHAYVYVHDLLMVKTIQTYKVKLKMLLSTSMCMDIPLNNTDTGLTIEEVMRS